MSAQFVKLKTLLREIFQLDQPDLDFGIYRILHARSAEIGKFLDEELLPQGSVPSSGVKGTSLPASFTRSF